MEDGGWHRPGVRNGQARAAGHQGRRHPLIINPSPKGAKEAGSVPKGWKLRNEPIWKNSQSPYVACMKPVFCDFFGRLNEPISGNLRWPIAQFAIERKIQVNPT